MAQQKIKIMISSRSDAGSIDDGNGGKIGLSDVRKAIKKRLHEEKIDGKPVFDVWINEDEEGDGADNSWEECIQQAEKCDLFVSLYSGDPGWQKDGSGIGICHAEYEAAFSQAPAKVKVLRIGKPKVNQRKSAEKLFFEAISKSNSYDSFISKNASELMARTITIARELLLKAAHTGCREFRQSGPNMGEALEWSRMDYSERAENIRQSLSNALNEKQNSEKSFDENRAAIVELQKTKILFMCHAIPAAFGVSAAKEMVGQPFLRDYQYIQKSGSADVAGPVHIIGCSKSVTEAQAIGLLGFPDAIFVSGSFGVYVADRIQKIQMCLIPNCRDASSTRHGLQRLFEWLDRSDELNDLAQRAKSRRAIIDATLGQLS